MPFDHEALYQRFLSDGVKPSEKAAWFAERADELGATVDTVRKAIEDCRDYDLFGQPGAKITAAQLVANEIGATRAAALRKLNALLEATRKIKVHNREGALIDEYDEPDVRTQMTAAEKILKVHGAMNDKLEIHVDRQDSTLSDAELEERIKKLSTKLIAADR